MKASVGATVANVAAAVAAFQATSTFTPQTLVTVMGGPVRHPERLQGL